MARQRDYKAEYAARTARARARGYTGYAQERKARESIKQEFERLKTVGIVPPDINPRTKTGQEKLAPYEKAYQYIREKNLSGERGASQQLPEKLKQQIRAQFTDPETGELDPGYYPAMRKLYRSGPSSS